MRRLLTIIGLQAYAIVLAVLQYDIGVRTDEAKYLLSIPYPHPPLARFIFSLNRTWPLHDLFWRVILATLLVHAVWLVWDLGRDLRLPNRWLVSAAWVFSSAVILQAGTVMMAPLTALQALVLMWLLSRPEFTTRYRGLIGLFWLASLFTSFHAVLYGPIMLLLCWRMRCSLWEKIAYLCIPVGLLVLYTLSNPLALQKIFVHADLQAGEPVTSRIADAAKLWLIGGSFLVSILSTLGMIRARRFELLLSLLIVLVYVAPARYDYYAIFMTPLVVVGFADFLRRYRVPWPVLATGILIGSGIAVWWHGWPPSLPVRATVKEIESVTPASGVLLIDGAYGHEWQYESSVPVRRYDQSLLSGARALVCLTTCDAPVEGWKKLENVTDFQVWVPAR